MGAEERVFRPAAVGRLAASDEMDALPDFTPPGEWLALAAVGVLLAAALAWGVFGRVDLPAGAGDAHGEVQRVPPLRLLVPGPTAAP